MRLGFALLCGLASLAVSVQLVFAHAEPALVKPGDKSVLTSPPTEVAITMSQEMFDDGKGSNDIDVVNSAGVEVTAVSAVLDRNDRSRLSVPLPTTLAPGAYTVKWKTLSADDGDAAQGELSFTYDPNGTANPGTEELKADVPGGDDGQGDDASSPVTIESPDDGVTWVLVAAVGLGMFVLGAGGTFLLVQKKT